MAAWEPQQQGWVSGVSRVLCRCLRHWDLRKCSMSNASRSVGPDGVDRVKGIFPKAFAAFSPNNLQAQDLQALSFSVLPWPSFRSCAGAFIHTMLLRRDREYVKHEMGRRAYDDVMISFSLNPYHVLRQRQAIVVAKRNYERGPCMLVKSPEMGGLGCFWPCASFPLAFCSHLPVNASTCRYRLHVVCFNILCLHGVSIEIPVFSSGHGTDGLVLVANVPYLEASCKGRGWIIRRGKERTEVLAALID